jgi:hypothetical protein
MGIESMRHLDESLLNEYLDEVLDQSARHKTEAHLDICPDCQARLNDLRVVFYGLGLLTEKPLDHDLTPVILSRLPESRLSPGWRVALAIQAGLSMGLLGAIAQVVFRALQPMLYLQLQTNAWADLTNNIMAHVPDINIQPMNLSGYSLPFSTPVTIALLVAVVILWGLGNARLLKNGYEVQQ